MQYTEVHPILRINIMVSKMLQNLFISVYYYLNDILIKVNYQSLFKFHQNTDTQNISILPGTRYVIFGRYIY